MNENTTAKESQELAPRDCHCAGDWRKLRVKTVCEAERIDLLANKVRCLIQFVTGLIEMEGLCVRNASTHTCYNTYNIVT